MGYRDIILRIRDAVEPGAYLVPTRQIDPRQRDAMALVAAEVVSPDFDPLATVQRIREQHRSGQIDRVMMLSALGVVAASPQVQDYEEASRLASLQELAALELGGPHRQANLASADRHRGVLAFLMGRPEVALEWFTSALERERSAENLGNVMAALIKAGEPEEARDLLETVRACFPVEIRDGVEQIVAKDGDLAALRARRPS